MAAKISRYTVLYTLDKTEEIGLDTVSCEYCGNRKGGRKGLIVRGWMVAVCNLPDVHVSIQWVGDWDTHQALNMLVEQHMKHRYFVLPIVSPHFCTASDKSWVGTRFIVTVLQYCGVACTFANL